MEAAPSADPFAWPKRIPFPLNRAEFEAIVAGFEPVIFTDMAKGALSSSPSSTSPLPPAAPEARVAV